MVREARLVLPGWLHHVTQRGNQQQTVYFSDLERIFYLRLAGRYFRKYGVALVGYCLMTNHSHLFVVPQNANSLERGVGRMHRDFAKWQNIQLDRTGHVWQNRFYSCPVEQERAWQVLSYIELNPVRAGLVANAWDWRWSSARAHITGVDESGLLDMHLWREHHNGTTWTEFLQEAAEKPSIAARIRLATRTGRLLASDETTERIERELGRRLRPAKAGRKRKPRNEGMGILSPNFERLPDGNR